MKNLCRISMFLVVVMMIYLQNAQGRNLKIAGNSSKPKGTLKTIMSEDGDVINCVDIYKQPSLDHPLLQNHTIQMRPSSYPTGLLERTTPDTSMTVSQSWSEHEECPVGTVPIRRTNGGESISRVRQRRLPIDEENEQPQKFAAAFQRTSGQTMFGLSAIISLWQPATQPSDSSVAQLWLGYEPGFDQTESVEAGWEVNPHHYGNGATRLFVAFTNNNYQTYCHNMDCPGFILVDRSVTPGASFTKVSSFKGPIYMIDIGLFRDSQTNNLWFHYGGKAVGYWPSSLFKHLQGGSNAIGWGGEVYAAERASKTAMGSGHFPEEGGSYFSQMQFVDVNQKVVKPYPNVVKTTNTNWGSYHALPVTVDMTAGANFFYGGPGGH